MKEGSCMRKLLDYVGGISRSEEKFSGFFGLDRGFHRLVYGL
jgi:hypothetical protein